MSDIVERLNDIWSNDDHARGCQGREYDCTCGFDGRTFSTAKEAADTIEALRQKLLAAEKALEDEREACAEIADHYANSNSEYLPEEVVIACGNTANDIAATIRQRTTLKAQGITKPDDGREG